MKIDTKEFELIAGYGLSDNITIGVIVPFREYKKDLKFSIANGNIGVNPRFNHFAPVSPTNLPYLPSSMAGVHPLNEVEFQRLLGSRALDLGYKPLESITNRGLADPTLGLLWQAYNQNKSSLVLGLGYRFGIAEEDDPDNILNTQISNGNSAIRLRAEYLKDLGEGFDLYGKMEYGRELEDSVTKRIPKEGELLPLLSSKESLTRHIGDYRTYNIGVGKSWSNYRVALNWYRVDKDRDHYNSAKGTDTSLLEKDSDSYSNQYRASLSWSGVESWRKGEIPFPLIVNLTYKDTYSAKNALDWRVISLQVTTLF